MGSNLGDRQMFIAYGMRRLSRMEHSLIGGFSGLFATEPVGISDKLPFLNMVAKIYTLLDPRDLLVNLRQIEHEAGRTDLQRKKSRVLDMDILLYDDDIIEEDELVIPHPELHNRRFVLEPLAEIAGDLVHPVQQKTIRELLDECPADYWVQRLH